MKTIAAKEITQIFDELTEFVAPEHRASWERMGRRLKALRPDDEILLLVYYVAILV